MCEYSVGSASALVLDESKVLALSEEVKKLNVKLELHEQLITRCCSELTYFNSVVSVLVTALEKSSSSALEESLKMHWDAVSNLVDSDGEK